MTGDLKAKAGGGESATPASARLVELRAPYLGLHGLADVHRPSRSDAPARRSLRGNVRRRSVAFRSLLAAAAGTKA